MDARPIIRLPDGRYFVFSSFLLAESIYLSPFYWMKDDTSYADTASINRGESTAEIAAEMLRLVFGSRNVFRDVKVKLSKSKTLTDVDVLVAHRNKVLVIQAKSKRLTMLSRIGNEDHLARDFKLAVQDAYEQGKISRNAILHQEISLEGSDKKEIQLDESVDEVYLICLTSDPYPAVALQTRIFLSKTTADPFR